MICNFNDAVIYVSDLALVHSNTAWLNDAIIHFFFELLKERFGEMTNHYMDPAVLSFFVHQCTDEDEIEEFATGLSLPTPCKLFVPVNDNMVTSKSWMKRGGSHWSLLLISKDESKTEYWHFDSIPGSGNIEAAKSIASKLGKHCFDSKSTLPLIEAETPKQSNGYDCGLHMLEAARLFSELSMAGLKIHETTLKEYVKNNPDFCSNLRKEIAAEIHRISKCTSPFDQTH